MKKFRNKKTGELATYQDGILNTKRFSIKTGIEPSKEIWEEILDFNFPVGTKVIDTFNEEYIYTKTKNGKWKIGTQDYFSINENQIGKNKRFKLLKNNYKILSFISNNESIHDKENDIYKTVIYSIKNLDNNEVFTLNDTVIYNNEIFFIKSFLIINKMVEILISNHRIYFTLNINEVNKGNTYLNKVCLSAQDIFDIEFKYRKDRSFESSPMAIKILELVKKKISEKN